MLPKLLPRLAAIVSNLNQDLLLNISSLCKLQHIQIQT